MMWMYFHTLLNDTVLFKFWHVTSPGDMVISCLIAMLLAISVEFVKYQKSVVEEKSLRKISTKAFGERLATPEYLLITALFVGQWILSNLVMLVYMVFSLWLCLSLALGSVIGYYLFGARPAVGV
ncbi:unnamed protein product [Bursaphelenchus xylophilus]|uniref:Copper transport protein n=1 Tax=Bursaphelenchus xylophilus TaxID=6326 RepID=A0A1I7SXB8_BURXY|nr:unnamed protein product [Bursaphelenchus xylophilus]CAG9100314.1 unnamed protein product [Bursaphelenchus xylophilus]